jgi:hypothetical protein
MSDESFESLWHQAIESHVAGMSDPDLAARGLARVQATAAPTVDESNLPITRSSGFAQKCGQLADLTAAANGQGYQHGITDAANAYGGIKPPEQPQPEPVAPQPTPMSVNRGQGGSSGGGPPAESERSRNSRLIQDLRGQ